MTVEDGCDKAVVVTAGVAYTYVKEALKRLGTCATVVKLGMSVPLPRKISEVVKGEAIVVEEGDPVVETQLRALGVSTRGKLDGYFPRYGELTTGKVAAGIAKALGLPYSPPAVYKSPMPFVEEAYIITGPYDLLFKVWARDVKQLSTFLVAYLASNPDIQRTETLIVLEIVDDWRRRVMPPSQPA